MPPKGAAGWLAGVLLTLPLYAWTASGAAPPNIVFILVDDMESSLVGGDWHMPLLARHLADEGANATSAIVNFALCCPSRATFLTGRCAHNTGVIGNYWPLGSVHRFNSRGLELMAVPRVLQQSGYRTALIGKYLNGYRELPPSYIPDGYNRWFAMRSQGYYDWTVSDQGIGRHFGGQEEHYSTDVLTKEAVEFIRNAGEGGRPFFLYLSPFAPHLPAIPARRHMGTLKGLKVPRVPSWNESDASIRQKVTPRIRGLPPLTEQMAAQYDFKYQKKAESLLAVDEQIDAVVQALADIGQLDNTYIFFTSDNGFKLGHRRKTEKSSPYEEDVRVPLYIRGPGVPRGVKLPHLISNIDFAPTWLELAGVQDPWAEWRDGKSFARVLRSKTARADPDSFRIGVLIEKLNDGTMGGKKARVVSSMVPLADPQNDVFAGLRLEQLPNGSWPVMLKGGEDDVDDERDQGTETGWKMLERLATRNGILLRQLQRAINKGGSFPDPYYALRIQSTAGSYKLIEYSMGFELYDLDSDPYEANNIYTQAPQSLVEYLVESLNSLKICAGSELCSIQNVTQLIEAQQGA